MTTTSEVNNDTFTVERAAMMPIIYRRVGIKVNISQNNYSCRMPLHCMEIIFTTSQTISDGTT